MPALSSLDLRRKQFAVSLVRAAFPDPGSATRLGITYLRNVPAESDIASLLYALSAESPSLVEMATRNEEVNLMITLHRIIKSDFERGEVVNIGGWIVARTEARLSALASLV